MSSITTIKTCSICDDEIVKPYALVYTPEDRGAWGPNLLCSNICYDIAVDRFVEKYFVVKDLKPLRISPSLEMLRSSHTNEVETINGVKRVASPLLSPTVSTTTLYTPTSSSEKEKFDSR